MPDHSARAEQVIITNLHLRGDGREDPMRAITQVWGLDGSLIAEMDPRGAEKLRKEELTARMRISDANWEAERLREGLRRIETKCAESHSNRLGRDISNMVSAILSPNATKDLTAPKGQSQ